MPSLGEPVADAVQASALDRILIEQRGYPSVVLMDAAGRAVAKHVMQRYPRGRVAVVCGPGNNGGDGYVIGRILHALGRHVDVIAACPPNQQGALFAKLCHHVHVGQGPGCEAASSLLRDAAVIVDALLGTGARAVDGELAAWVHAMNQATAAIVAVDVPSGVCATTGQILGEVADGEQAPASDAQAANLGVAVRADLTICLITRKLGLETTPGKQFAGEVQWASLELAQADVTPHVSARLLTAQAVAHYSGPLTTAAATSHKGTRGAVGVVAGSPEMAGAGRLAALAALRSGAGLVRWLCDGATQAPDPIIRVLYHDQAARVAQLASLATSKVLVVGPGLGRDADALALTQATLALAQAQQLPVVLDADGLYWLAQTHGATSPAPATLPIAAILTPHPQEAARLLACTAAEVNRDRPTAARRLAARYGAVVVLKGHRSIIAAPSGELAICPTGNQALATAGTGDVLAGVIGGLVAQGLSGFAAAAVGTYVHGVAGDMLAAVQGPRGAIASDLLDVLPSVLAAIRLGVHDPR